MYGKSGYKRAVRRTYRKKSNTKKSFVRRLPARGRFNRKRYNTNKKIGAMLSKYQENKLVACGSQNETQPAPIQTAAQATFIAYNLGTVAVFNGATTVGGINMRQGVAENERVGNYAYYKKTHLTLRVEMNTGTNAPPIQFRVIVAKLRRYANPAGITPSFASSGFMEPDGTPFGHTTSGKSGLDLMMLPLNKRQWVIYKDMKFVLQPYNDLGSQTTNIIYNNYPACKEIFLNLPHYKKCFFDGPSAITPNDLEFRYQVIIYGHSLGRSGIVADSYECSLRGTTSYSDC